VSDSARRFFPRHNLAREGLKEAYPHRASHSFDDPPNTGGRHWRANACRLPRAMNLISAGIGICVRRRARMLCVRQGCSGGWRISWPTNLAEFLRGESRTSLDSVLSSMAGRISDRSFARLPRGAISEFLAFFLASLPKERAFQCSALPHARARKDADRLRALARREIRRAGVRAENLRKYGPGGFSRNHAVVELARNRAQRRSGPIRRLSFSPASVVFATGRGPARGASSRLENCKANNPKRAACA